MRAAATIACAETHIGALDFAAIVRAGDRVVCGQGGAEPTTLTRRLIAQKDRIRPFEIFLGPLYSETFAPERTAGIRLSAYGAIGRAAALSRAGRLEIVRRPYKALADEFADGAQKADVVLIQLAAPLPGRGLSFGLANDYVAAAARHARVVVAEINSHIPWTHGAEVPADFPLHVCVQATEAPVDVASAPLTATEQKIVEHVAALVPDGAVLQIGVGTVPDAILAGLTRHRDLGFHSGLMNDRVVDLIERGVVTNASKRFDRGISVANILLGTNKLRAHVHDNPAIRVAPPHYSHGLPVLSRIEKFIAINSAIEVDLTGSVNSETAQGIYIGGIGGVRDFIAGANAADGGRAVVALPSTDRSGKSRIVADVATVTVEGAAAHTIVTEWGVAELRGCDVEERARRMTAIAAPQFRDDLARLSFERRSRGG
jgi:acyl-CoA hydrolase